VTTEHYFTAEPGSEAGRRVVEFDAAGRTFRLVASGGVFSSGRLDPGTAVLLRKAPVPTGQVSGSLLDLGCGYGPIAAVLAACAPAATVYAVDVNRRALELARDNLADVRRGNVVVSTPDEVDQGVRFEQIWSNPPIRIGKDELHRLLDRWLPRLTEDGTGWLVVARHLGADSLQAWLGDRGWRVDRHASQKGYRIFRVTRDQAAGPVAADAPTAGNPGDTAATTPDND
jgi:16S rRNA G1207 methylase RsmC